jgi:hypothetical protein
MLTIIISSSSCFGRLYNKLHESDAAYRILDRLRAGKGRRAQLIVGLRAHCWPGRGKRESRLLRRDTPGVFWYNACASKENARKRLCVEEETT